jgi:hypothetical protein
MSKTAKPPSATASGDPPGLLALAGALLERLGGLFQAAVARAAALCAADGALDPGRLDAHQGVAYEVALAHADLLTARAASVGAASGSDLDRRLGLAFIAMFFLWGEGTPYWIVAIPLVLMGIGVGLAGSPIAFCGNGGFEPADSSSETVVSRITRVVWNSGIPSPPGTWCPVSGSACVKSAVSPWLLSGITRTSRGRRTLAPS